MCPRIVRGFMGSNGSGTTSRGRRSRCTRVFSEARTDAVLLRSWLTARPGRPCTWLTQPAGPRVRLGIGIGRPEPSARVGRIVLWIFSARIFRILRVSVRPARHINFGDDALPTTFSVIEAVRQFPAIAQLPIALRHILLRLSVSSEGGHRARDRYGSDLLHEHPLQK